uniref:Post-GPI attachment to proteins factor 3 n=1 Tax=Brassica oleracea var. oleracea TaxID=109376 RepID=A0A0D3EA91_BRAOL
MELEKHQEAWWIHGNHSTKIVSHHTAGNYMKSKKANKKFNFKETDMVAMMRRAHGHCQNPASVTFSVLSLAVHFHGWLSFFITLYYKLPLKQDRTVFHTRYSSTHYFYHPQSSGDLSLWFLRDVDITKMLDYSSAIAVLGFSLIVSILRTFDVRVEAARVMIYDFPPYGGYFDAHSIWHLATVPLTILWWSFIRDDAEFRTSSLLKKSKTKAK